MSDLYNFTRNLRRIVKPPMRERGFKHKGVQFLKALGDVELVVLFQRSLWSNTLHGWQQSGADLTSILPTKSPAKFYVNLDFRLDATRLPGYFEEPPFERLHHPRAAWPFRDMSRDERLKWWEGLSREEILTRLEIPHPHDWTYTSEEELCEQLELAVHELVARGIPYLETVAPILYEPNNGEHIRTLKKSLLRQRTT